MKSYVKEIIGDDSHSHIVNGYHLSKQDKKITGRTIRATTKVKSPTFDGDHRLRKIIGSLGKADAYIPMYFLLCPFFTHVDLQPLTDGKFDMDEFGTK